MCSYFFLMNINQFLFQSVNFRGDMLTLAPFLWQSSSLPVEGPLVSEEANHTESTTNTGTPGDTVVGK